MNILYVYYSRTQRTESAVLTLKRLVGGNERIVKIVPSLGYGGPIGCLRGIFGTFSKKNIKLLAGDPVDLSEYDRVVIATPVWASQAPPPIRTFFRKNTGAKSTAYLATCAGGSCDVLFDELDVLTGCKRVAALALDGMKDDGETKIKAFAEQISR